MLLPAMLLLKQTLFKRYIETVLHEGPLDLIGWLVVSSDHNSQWWRISTTFSQKSLYGEWTTKHCNWESIILVRMTEKTPTNLVWVETLKLSNVKSQIAWARNSQSCTPTKRQKPILLERMLHIFLVWYLCQSVWLQGFFNEAYGNNALKARRLC